MSTDTKGNTWGGFYDETGKFSIELGSGGADVQPVVDELVKNADYFIQGLLIIAFLVGAVIGYRLMYRRGNV
jgi:hypothetical protein